MSDLFTYRVVCVYSDKGTFSGASGYYGTELEAKGALFDIARTWIGPGLATPVLRADGSVVCEITENRSVTYSVLRERAFLSQPVKDVATPESEARVATFFADMDASAKLCAELGIRP